MTPAWMTLDEAKTAYSAAARAESGESQEWAYLRYRFLATDDEDERIARANDMRHMAGLPSVGHGLSSNMWAMLTSQAMQGLVKAERKAGQRDAS